MNCNWKYSDKNRSVLVCTTHKDERIILAPHRREQTLTELAGRGDTFEFTTPAAAPSASPEPDGNPSLPSPPGGASRGEASPPVSLPSQPPAPGTSLTPVPPPQAGPPAVEYTAFEGQKVSLTVQLFREMICPDATPAQAYYMLQWCAHNRIDPFANEAYFSVMDGKPVIQVSKDAWFRRMERHPSFVSHASGIIVDTAVATIRDAVVGGLDDYLISAELRAVILSNFSQGKIADPTGVSSRLKVRKLSHYLAAGENLLGGWAEIARSDRPEPYRFYVNKEGWETKKGDGQPNVFWNRKEPFMIWKTALKNCARLALPELSGLLSQPEAREEDSDTPNVGIRQLGTREQQKMLFALGKKVQPPLGPLTYPQLHALSLALYDGHGISELSPFELSCFVGIVQKAADGDGLILRDLAEVIHEMSEEKGETQNDDSTPETEEPDTPSERGRSSL